MSDAGAFDPYAPPKAELDGPIGRSRVKSRAATPGVRKALKRLNKHLDDPDAVARDRAALGPRIRVVTYVFAGLFSLSILLCIAGADDTRGPLLPIGIGLAVITGIFAALLLYMDLSLIRRDVPDARTTPEATLKSFLKSFAMGRHGYGWATLCPTAREQTVRAPVLGPVATGDGEFTMDHSSALKAYAQTFARPGRGNMRQMTIKRVSPVDVDGDVAKVEVHAIFQSWPQWVTIVMAVSFVIFRPLILVGIVLYFVLRRRHEVTFTKIMLCGKDGLWYVYDAELLEGQNA